MFRRWNFCQRFVIRTDRLFIVGVHVVYIVIIIVVAAVIVVVISTIVVIVVVVGRHERVV